MKTAAEYRKHADECQALAKQVPDGEHRNQLLEMARTWGNLAADREKLGKPKDVVRHVDANGRPWNNAPLRGDGSYGLRSKCLVLIPGSNRRSSGWAARRHGSR